MGSFSSDNSIEKERFYRQRRRCALCAKIIFFENYQKGDKGAWVAHHIDGNPNNCKFSNCACVCINEPENCHLKIAHGGDFTNGKLAPKSKFHLQGWSYIELLVKRIFL